MIIGWIIQPQIDKLSEQRKQLDSLRVDIKVEIFLIKRQLAEKKITAAVNQFQKFVKALRQLGVEMEGFGRLKYHSGGYIGFKDNPIAGINQREYTIITKKNINGNN